MNRPGVMSLALLLGQPDMLARYVVAYDELWIPGVSKNSSLDQIGAEESDEEDQQHLASVAYLASEQFLREPPIDFARASNDPVTQSLKEWYRSEDEKWDAAFETAEEAAIHGAVLKFNMDKALTRLVSYVLWRDQKEVVYPVAFPFYWADEAEGLPTDVHSVLSVVLERLPVPSETLPLQDLLAFKRDPDTQYKYARFWRWIRDIAKKNLPAQEIAEELDWLMTDYSEHLKQLTKEVRYDQVETLVSAVPEVLENVVKIKWGSAVKPLFSIGRKRIEAKQEEMKLPGSEVAYISQATRLLRGGSAT